MPRSVSGIPRSALALIGVVLLAMLFVWGQRGGEDRQPAETLPTARITLEATPSTSPSTTPSTTPPTTQRATVDTGRIAYGDLPREAVAVIEAIEDGGPFDYDRDGSTFGNRERLLPQRPRGWYREYTVRTPGESDRGARRIVGGEDGTLYWTDDHYASFRVIVGLP